MAASLHEHLPNNSAGDLSFMINMDFLGSTNSPSKTHETSDINILAANIDFLNATFMDLIAKNTELQNQVSKLIGQVHTLEKDLAHYQQYGRRENVEITGIPESVSNENLLNYILLLFSKIGMGNLTRESFHGWHRLKRKSRNKPANVIVRFVNRQDAYDALERRKLLKGIPGHQNIYIIENLCPKYQEIYDKCNELKRDHSINRAWTYNGIVHYKTSNQRNSRGKKVFHMDELSAAFPPAFTSGFPPRASPPAPLLPPPPPALMDIGISPPDHLVSVVPVASVIIEPAATAPEPVLQTETTLAESSRTSPVVEIDSASTSPVVEIDSASTSPVVEIDSAISINNTAVDGTIAVDLSTESVAAVCDSTPPTESENDLEPNKDISPPSVISCSPQEDGKLCPRECSGDSDVSSEDEEVSINPRHTSKETKTSNLISPLCVSDAEEIVMNERSAEVGDISIKLGMYAPPIIAKRAIEKSSGNKLLQDDSGDGDLSFMRNDIDLDSSLALNSTLETMSATAAAVKIMDGWSTAAND